MRLKMVNLSCAYCGDIGSSEPLDLAQHYLEQHSSDKVHCSWASTIIENAKPKTAVAVKEQEVNKVGLFGKKKVEAPVIAKTSNSELQLATQREHKLEQVEAILENRPLSNGKVPNVLVEIIKLETTGETRATWKKALLTIIDLLYPD